MPAWSRTGCRAMIARGRRPDRVGRRIARVCGRAVPPPEGFIGGLRYFKAGRSFFRTRPLIFNSIGVPTNPNLFRS